MKKIKLFDRSEEIFNKLPKEYGEVILNAIFAKSVENGSLFSEVKLFLNSSDFEEFKRSFKNSNKDIIPKEVVSRTKEETFVSKRKTKAEISEEKAVESFIL